MRGAARAAAGGVPLLGDLDLDLQRLRWHSVQSARARRALRAELAAAPVDVVHVHSHTIALGLTGELARIPWFVSIDATIESWERMAAWRQMRPYSRALLQPSLARERRLLASATTVLAWTDWARRQVEAICPQARLVVHAPGIDLSRFQPAPRRPRKAPRVLFVGGRFEQKGGFDLLAALEPSLGHGVELDLVTTASVAERPGVRVHRLGHGDPRLVDLFQQADVFCLPTHADTFGIVLAEAMGTATPVVSTRVGAIPEVLDGGRAGILVQPRDRAGLRAALERLLGDAEVRERLGERGRARCEQRFDTRKQTAALLDLMRAAVSG
jgi:glycosyltransferase involved in cell wall biosynthesis